MTCSTSAVFLAASSTGRAFTAGFVSGGVDDGVLVGWGEVAGAAFTLACTQLEAIPVGVEGTGGGGILSYSSVVVFVVSTGTDVDGVVACS